MNKEKTKTTKSQKKRAIISIFLIAAILVGGAFAFLTAQDSKTNVFTIGNISINLVENFDADGDGVTEVYDSNTKTPPTRENIIPGVDIAKEPYVENTSNNPCRLYMTVQVPAISKAAASSTNDEAYELTGNQEIVVKAYAIQDGYADKTDKNEIWTSYFNKNIGSMGEQYTGEERVQVFDIKNISSDWEQLGDVYQSANGNNYYTYVYVGTGDYLLAGHTTSSSLFTQVALAESIGSPAA